MNTINLAWERYVRSMDDVVARYPELIGRRNDAIEKEIERMRKSVTITIRISQEENEALEEIISAKTEEIQASAPGAKISKSSMVRALLASAIRANQKGATR